MQALKVQVKNGRLRLDEPTDLPDGAEVEVVVLDDEMSAEDKCFAHFWSAYFYAHAGGQLAPLGGGSAVGFGDLAPDAMVEAVLDVIAPLVDPRLPGMPPVRVPVIKGEYEGQAVTPDDAQCRALAEQIVTRIRTASGGAR